MANLASEIELDSEREDDGAVLRVAVIDDHVVDAEGLAQLLDDAPDLEVVGFARSVAEGIELIERTLPDVAVIESQLPDGDGARATKAILTRWPQVAVVMLTDSGANDVLVRAIEAGCVGFLNKGLNADLLVDAVRSVARGEVVILAELLRETFPELERTSFDPYDLTPREVEILRLLAEGATTDQVAEELFVARDEVRDNIANVLSKLGAHSRLDAVALATREGLIVQAG